MSNYSANLDAFINNIRVAAQRVGIESTPPDEVLILAIAKKMDLNIGKRESAITAFMAHHAGEGYEQFGVDIAKLINRQFYGDGHRTDISSMGWRFGHKLVTMACTMLQARDEYYAIHVV